MIPAALLWDLDGTLIDSEPVHRAAFDDTLAELGLTVAADFHDRMLGVNGQGIHAALVAETGATLSHAEWQVVKWAHYKRRSAGIRLRPAVAEVAVHWAELGYPSAVVSNSTADELAVALAATGLERIFATTISVADVSRGKPDPEGYHLAARRLGVASEACLAIEDSPVGVAAGRAAGMQVVFHPQTPAANPATLAPGAHYLAPGQALGGLIATVMRSGSLW